MEYKFVSSSKLKRVKKYLWIISMTEKPRNPYRERLSKIWKEISISISIFSSVVFNLLGNLSENQFSCQLRREVSMTSFSFNHKHALLKTMRKLRMVAIAPLILKSMRLWNINCSAISENLDFIVMQFWRRMRDALLKLNIEYLTVQSKSTAEINHASGDSFTIRRANDDAYDRKLFSIFKLF